MIRKDSVDRPFLFISIMLVVAGFLIYVSASLGLLVRDGARFGDVVLNQVLFGIVIGVIFAYCASRIPPSYWKRASPYIFITSIIITLLVFVPGIGFEHGGAKRWIDLKFITFQPSEFLKIGFVIYFAAWLSSVKDRIQTFRFGILPMTIILVIAGAILLAEPDTATFGVIFVTVCAMFIAGHGKIKHIVTLFIIGLCLLALLAYARPYVKDRLHTFINPSADPQGSGYQIKQSTIAIGSGGIFGKGSGQSIQKFNYLPEPTGDSIFAVAAEEFGFVGASILIVLFLAFGARGLSIAARASDSFSGLLTVGIVILIISQSFMNMASMLGLIPLSGLPLVFVSHGGTAMMFAIIEVGIILGVSRKAKW